jgi:hypothetical protein
MVTSTYRPLVVILLLSACAAGSSVGPGAPVIDLRVEFRADTDADTNVATLQCSPAESATGFLAPRAHAACEAATANRTLLTEPPDPNRACTQIYGGPETARVTGTVEGRRVDRVFRRNDGCGISDWDKLKALIDSR